MTVSKTSWQVQATSLWKVIHGTASGLNWVSPQYVQLVDEYHEWIPHGLRVLDLDGDGKKDLLVTGAAWHYDDPYSAAILWKLGVGNRQFAAMGWYSTGGSWDIGPSGLDYISLSVGDAEGPPIGVWPNLVFDPVGVMDTDLKSRSVRATPSVSATPIRIDLAGLAQPFRSLEILDVRGAHVRALPVERPETKWDLRDASGHDVPSGVYGIRLQDHERRPTTPKIQVVR